MQTTHIPNRIFILLFPGILTMVLNAALPAMAAPPVVQTSKGTLRGCPPQSPRALHTPRKFDTVVHRKTSRLYSIPVRQLQAGVSLLHPVSIPGTTTPQTHRCEHIEPMIPRQIGTAVAITRARVAGINSAITVDSTAVVNHPITTLPVALSEMRTEVPTSP